MSERMPVRAVLFRAVVVAAVLLTGVGVFAVLRATAPELETAAPDRAVRRVEVVEPFVVEVRRQWRGYGTAAARRSADVPARVTATVTALGDGVDEGAAVGEGDVLATLDAADYTAEARRLEAQLAAADAALAELAASEARLAERLELERADERIVADELQRVRTLFENNVSNPQDVDRARSALLLIQRAVTTTAEQLDTVPARRTQLQASRDAAAAALDLARENVARTRVRSPIAGVVQAVDVEVGEAVAPGQRVARVVDPAVIEVPLALPASIGATLRLGDPVTLTPSTGGGGPWDATITRIAPETDAATRTLTAFAELDQSGVPAPLRLTPGRFVEAVVSTGDPAPRRVLPRRSIRRSEVQAVVPTENGVAEVRSRPIVIDYTLAGALPATGLPDDQWAVLADDSAPTVGTAVLLTSTATLLDGERVAPAAP